MPSQIVDIKTFDTVKEMPPWTRGDYWVVKKISGEHCLTAMRCVCGRWTIIQRLQKCPRGCGVVWFVMHSHCRYKHQKECPRLAEAGPF